MSSTTTATLKTYAEAQDGHCSTFPMPPTPCNCDDSMPTEPPNSHPTGHNRTYHHAGFVLLDRQRGQLLSLSRGPRCAYNSGACWIKLIIAVTRLNSQRQRWRDATRRNKAGACSPRCNNSRLSRLTTTNSACSPGGCVCSGWRACGRSGHTTRTSEADWASAIHSRESCVRGMVQSSARLTSQSVRP